VFYLTEGLLEIFIDVKKSSNKNLKKTLKRDKNIKKSVCKRKKTIPFLTA